MKEKFSTITTYLWHLLQQHYSRNEKIFKDTLKAFDDFNNKQENCVK